MAHERLSPRQKMIGMMYLVLTAMLALNVSKEAVEAFKKVDKGLTKTIANYVVKNNVIYDDFDKAAAQNPTKAGPYRDKAGNVRQRADELYNYIQDIKIEIINKAEGPVNTAVKGKEIFIDNVDKHIDDNNIPSEVLIGANMNGKAFALKTLLANFRDDMIKDVIGGKDANIESSLRTIFNTEDGLDKSGEKERWETLNFQALPLVAVVTLLSKLQVDVRNAETDIITFLYQQIDKKSFKFNKIIPIVKPTSTYVMVGNEYQADVFLSATDTTAAPEIKVGDFTTSVNADGTKTYTMVGTNFLTITADETGKGVYKVRPTSQGPKSWGGLISMKAPSGEILTIPFHEDYAVGANSVVVSPTAMNVLYLGIDNPIDISVPGIGNDKVRASMQNGTIGKGQVKNSKGEFFPGSWVAMPTVEGQMAQIVVSAEINGKVQQVGVLPFRVRRVPDPVAVFANVQGGNVTKGEIVAQSGVFAKYKDFDFDLSCQVTEFNLTFEDKGFWKDSHSNSARLTDENKAFLNSLTRGKRLIIEKIKAVGKDKKPRDLQDIVITVQ
jgi:gliding motility-associated protein GldM